MMSIVTQLNTLYEQIDIRKSYFLRSHMSLYLRYQGNYHHFSAQMANLASTSLLYP